MTKNERLEKILIIFLASALILGISVSSCRKSRRPANVTLGSFDAESYKNTTGGASSSIDQININTASPEELMTLKGVGRTTAERIVEYRYQNGSFASIDDLKNVKGVSVALFEKLRGKIRIE